MYRLFDHFWFQRVPITLIEAFTSFGPLPPVDLGDLRSRLPSATWPRSSTATRRCRTRRRIMRSCVVSRELTRHVDVVLLNTGQRFDDHEDMARVDRSRIHTIDH
jgi:hypothetical protein